LKNPAAKSVGKSVGKNHPSYPNIMIMMKFLIPIGGHPLRQSFLSNSNPKKSLLYRA
jgi:hypothetical protein